MTAPTGRQMPAGQPAQHPAGPSSPIQLAAMKARGQTPPMQSGADQQPSTQPTDINGPPQPVTMASSAQENPVPPLRSAPDAADGMDGARSAWAWSRWKSQDAIHAVRDRAIEEMVRMLNGQQWYVWYAPMGRFVDVSRFFSDDERRWRQRPVFNRLMPWFMMTHARMVENPPICTFIPGPDQFDAELAETMDNLAKPLWRSMGMVDANDRMWMWVVASGTGYIRLGLDPNAGDLETWTGIAPVPVLDDRMQPMRDPNNPTQPLTVVREDVPLDKDGQPLAFLTMRGELMPTGTPHAEREGALVPYVYSPFSVRGEWNDTPWHRKSWHQTLDYLTPEKIFQTWGVKVQPEALGTSGDGGQLERMTFGQGNFGANLQRFGSEMSAPQTGTDQYVRVLTTYDAPNDSIPGMAETLDSPGGRLLIVTGNQTVLYDGPRPIRWPYTSPIHRWDFVRLPGNNSGRTPLEPQVGPQRAYNRGWAQILEHRNLVTNPIALVDRGSGLGNVKVTNQPGKRYIVTARPGVKPMEWVAPPQLGQDVYETQELLKQELIDIGSLKGTEGAPPQSDASGELIKELRFNSDRVFGPTMRRAVEEYGRFTETLMAMMPLVYSRQKVISVAGDDNISRTVMVYPELFTLGHVKVIPDVESMIPDGLSEKQEDTLEMYREGLFGPIGSPQATRAFLELKNFPNRSRASRPGGPNRSTAEQQVGKLVQGMPAAQLPWFPWYDVATFLDVLENFMCSPDYLKTTPQIQAEFGQRWQLIKYQQALQMQAMMAQQAATAQAAGGGGGGGGGSGPKTPDTSMTPGPASAHAPSGVSPQAYPTNP